MNPVPELKDARLYDLLEAGGEQARASVRLLAGFVEEGGKTPAVFAGPAQAGAQIADEIRAHLLQAIVTSLPKADLEALASAIAAIPVAAGRFAQRFALAPASLAGLDLTPALNWLEELSEILLDTVRQLRGFASLDRIKELYPRLQTVAEHAETQIQEIVNRAYQHPATALDVMQVKDVGDQLIGIIERCREAGALMNKISSQFL